MICLFTCIIAVWCLALSSCHYRYLYIHICEKSQNKKWFHKINNFDFQLIEPWAFLIHRKMPPHSMRRSQIHLSARSTNKTKKLSINVSVSKFTDWEKRAQHVNDLFNKNNNTNNNLYYYLSMMRTDSINTKICILSIL